MIAAVPLAESVPGLAFVSPLSGGATPAGVYGGATPGTRTSGIQEAFDRAAAAGGGLVNILPGTYPISAPLRFRSRVAAIGYGATLVNAGELSQPFASGESDVLSGARIVGLVLDGAGVAGQTVLTLTSSQQSHADLRVIRAGKGSTGVRITTSATVKPVDDQHKTASSRSIYTFDIDDCATGLQLDGLDDLQVTNNAFPAVFITRCTGTGVNLLSHVDNNAFQRVHVQLTANDGVGFSIGTAGRVTVCNHNIVVKLTVDCYALTGATALVLNPSRGSHVLNLRTSGKGFSRVVRAVPEAENFTVYNATELVRYEGVPAVPFART